MTRGSVEEHAQAVRERYAHGSRREKKQIFGRVHKSDCVPQEVSGAFTVSPAIQRIIVQYWNWTSDVLL